MYKSLENHFGTELGKSIFGLYSDKIKYKHLYEELCELYVAINHYLRSDRKDGSDNVMEEIADVIILIDELWYDLGINVKEINDFDICNVKEEEDLEFLHAVVINSLGQLSNYICSIISKEYKIDLLYNECKEDAANSIKILIYAIACFWKLYGDKVNVWIDKKRKIVEALVESHDKK